MGRFRTATVVLAAFFLLGCGTAARPAAPPGNPVPADTIRLVADDYGRAGIAALATAPVSFRAFAGWFGRAGNFPASDEQVVPKPGRTLLAVAGDTGCRLADGVAVRRAGDDLRVDFTGGLASQTCTRSFGPIALLSVSTDAVAGIRTVNGVAPVAVTGPGVLTGFVRLASGPAAAVEIGPGAAALAARLERNRDAQALLGRPAHPGTRAFAFVLTGCRDTGAVLFVDRDHLSAVPVGGEGVACYVAEYYLAVFEVPTDLVHESPVLGD